MEPIMISDLGNQIMEHTSRKMLVYYTSKKWTFL